MSLADFLQPLFARGDVLFRKPPLAPPAVDADALRVLQSEFSRYLLELPGTPVPFAPEVAQRAATVTRDACWLLLSRQEDDDEVTRRVTMPGRAMSASEQLSADLTLRFLPRVHRRAKALYPADVLVRSLEDTLRRWPLSGVLCEIDDAPWPPEFHGHEGSMLLYAQRLSRNWRESWLPEGKAREYYQLVQARQGHSPS